MKKLLFSMIALWGILAFSPDIGAQSAAPNLSTGKTYQIVIVMDTVDDWSSGVRDGFRETLDNLLTQQHAKAEYLIYDTELKEENIPGILESIRKTEPDLICTINYPSAFADTRIAKTLTDPKYKFVSEDAIAEQAGIIASREKPGGNIAGVGVFLQMNSAIRLMKRINPKVKKLVFFTWDAMVQINTWFEQEISRACKEEGIELVEFAKAPHAEAEFEFLSKYAHAGEEYFVMGGISAFVYKDGSPADMNKLEPEYIKKQLSIPMLGYEDVTIAQGTLAGACVIWYDIGAQLAEKGCAF
jgi:ABC-type uncharacterized transport system substrate-binding protein